MGENKINTCWITVNRECNLRCDWCYAKKTKFEKKDEINYDDACKIVDLVSELNVKTIILIGGEPTLYSHIFELVKYIKNKNIRVVIVTNGILLSNENILKKYILLNVDSFSVSLKASSDEKYKELTGFNCFHLVMKAIKNLSYNKQKFSVSTVITLENINDFLDGLVLAKNNGANFFSLSFCYNFDTNGSSKKEFLKKNNPYLLAKKYEERYSEICDKLKGSSFSLEQTLPACVWKKEILDKMNKDHHLRSICQLLKGNGILFDTDMSLIPCNAMYELKYGKYGIDFFDKRSLVEYLESEYVREIFKKLRGIPSKKCLICDISSNCGGGCVTNWTNYSFDELKNMERMDFNNDFKFYK